MKAINFISGIILIFLLVAFELLETSSDPMQGEGNVELLFWGLFLGPVMIAASITNISTFIRLAIKKRSGEIHLKKIEQILGIMFFIVSLAFFIFIFHTMLISLVGAFV